MPQKWYDRQKESFKAMLWENKELRFSYCGNTYNVVIDNVTVYMGMSMSFSAYRADLYTQRRIYTIRRFLSKYAANSSDG